VVRLARVFVAWLAAFAVLLGSAHAGARYFACAPMNALLAAPCCSPHGHEDAEGGLDAPHAEARHAAGLEERGPTDGVLAPREVDGCCVALQMGKLPRGDAPALPKALAAPCVGRVPPCPPPCLATDGQSAPKGARASGRAPPKSPSRERAKLSVYLR
jgi:hypothetical protein